MAGLVENGRYFVPGCNNREDAFLFGRFVCKQLRGIAPVKDAFAHADKALAAWAGDKGISDEQFVIAAYQASQITSIAINADSWSLTFAGEQLRNIDDRVIRRDLELVMTSDYSVVGFDSVATAYREKVRRVIPTTLQEAIRRDCGDRNVQGTNGAYIIVLPTRCPLKLNPADAARTAAALRARPDLVDELNWHIAAVAAFRANATVLELQIRSLYRNLRSQADRPVSRS